VVRPVQQQRDLAAKGGGVAALAVSTEASSSQTMLPAVAVTAISLP
jgi:hypothetical protein